MTVFQLLKNSKHITREESDLFEVEYFGRALVIKKSGINNCINEIDLVKYLWDNGYSTYKIANNEFDDSDGFLIYEYIFGIDGFSTERNTEYFYSLGKAIGELHQYLNLYVKKIK